VLSGKGESVRRGRFSLDVGVHVEVGLGIEVLCGGFDAEFDQPSGTFAVPPRESAKGSEHLRIVLTGERRATRRRDRIRPYPTLTRSTTNINVSLEAMLGVGDWDP
jgi:hypothetical protein